MTRPTSLVWAVLWLSACADTAAPAAAAPESQAAPPPAAAEKPAAAPKIEIAPVCKDGKLQELGGCGHALGPG